jgi:hypothetical protein
MTALLVVLAALVALPVLLLAAFVLGPVVLVPVLVALCCVPVMLIAGAISRHARG